MPILWAVTPTCLPLIVRRCHRCGHDRYRASGKFRVNANGKLLDAWLLALCVTCGETIGLVVFERAHVRGVPPELLDRLHANDVGLVEELLQGPDLPRRNRLHLDWTDAWRLDTGVPGDPGDPGDDVLEVSVGFGARVPVRPARLISTGLGLSGAAVDRLVGDGRIVASVDPRRRVTGDFSFLLKR